MHQHCEPAHGVQSVKCTRRGDSESRDARVDSATRSQAPDPHELVSRHRRHRPGLGLNPYLARRGPSDEHDPRGADHQLIPNLDLASGHLHDNE
jgi:hypothetical protein